MDKKSMALTVAGIVFLVVAFLHLLRLVSRIQVMVSDYVVPLWFNAAGFVLALLLAWWMLKFSRK